VSPEVLMASGYAVFLISAAFALEWLSAHTHRRALRYRTAGFTYVEEHDHWMCPEGERLRLHEHDHQLRVARYRAPARICNACHRKCVCTTSDRGREIVRPLDPWPNSEAGRFHRTIALMLVVLGVVVLVVESLRHHQAAELALLLGLLGLAVLAARWLLHDLRLHPANFPAPDGTSRAPAASPRSASGSAAAPRP